MLANLEQRIKDAEQEKLTLDNEAFALLSRFKFEREDMQKLVADLSLATRS